MKTISTLKNSKIYVGSQLLPRLKNLAKISAYQKVVIFADQPLKSQGERLRRSLGKNSSLIVVSGGEKLKSIKSLYPLYGKLLKRGVARDSIIVALGGGSIGDAIGFLASTYLRGVKWISAPTTLLAQVDSGVGGKTGVNHEVGKNLIGTFYQPALVVCDVSFLRTLHKRDLISGLGEVIKYGLAYDKSFFNDLKKNWSQLLKGNLRFTEKCVSTSLQWKSKAVAHDEFDRKGLREVLNLGHTFGHALEAVTKFKTFRHGEAVLWGLKFATCLSCVRGHLDQAKRDEIMRFLNEIPLPQIKKGSEKRIFKAMLSDKKMWRGKLRFVLLKNVGQTVSDDNVKPSDLHQAFLEL